MTLKDARIEFTSLLAILLLFARSRGYQPALAEGMDRKTSKDPTSDHMQSSLHDIGLAQDIDLYDKQGVYLTNSSDHATLGALWKSLHPYCRWGGDFGDGNHYSFSDYSIPGCVTLSGALRK